MPASPLSPGHAPSHYDILEVSHTASPEVIRAAYRSLMQRYHPDKNPGDKQAAERAVLVAQAYETLSDAERRAAYDQSLNELYGNVFGVYNDATATSSATYGQEEKSYSRERPHIRATSPKSRISFIILLCACVLIAAVFWVLIITVRRIATPDPHRPTSPANPPVTAEAPPHDSPAVRRRLRIMQTSPQSVQSIPPLPQDDALPVSGTATAEKKNTTGREIPALVTDLSVALMNPKNPGEATGYRLEIPVIAIRLGGKQTASARDHLSNMATSIRQALEARLQAADYDSLMTFNGEVDLARQILTTIAQATSLPVCAEDAGQDADDCYGLVAVRLPEAYVVK